MLSPQIRASPLEINYEERGRTLVGEALIEEDGPTNIHMYYHFILFSPGMGFEVGQKGRG